MTMSSVIFFYLTLVVGGFIAELAFRNSGH